MRNFLKQNFWSHGTPLGYVGSLSQKGPPEIFSKWVLFNLSNPLRHPAPLVDPLLTKNLDTAGPWCAIFCPSNPLALYVLHVSNISSQYFRYQTPGGASGSSVVTTSLATQPALSLTRQTVSSQPPPHG